MSSIGVNNVSKPQASEGPQDAPDSLLRAEAALYEMLLQGADHFDFVFPIVQTNMMFVRLALRPRDADHVQGQYVPTPALLARMEVVKYIIGCLEEDPDRFKGNRDACVELITSVWRTRLLPLVQNGDATWAELGFADPFTKRLHP